MNILLVMLGDLANKQGGMEQVLCKLANNMSFRGHKVSILTYGPNDGMPFYELQPEVSFFNLGINKRIHRTFINLSNIFILDKEKKEFRRDYYVCKNMARTIKDSCLSELDFDIVVTFDKKSLFVIKSFLKAKAPVVNLFRFDPETILSNRYFFEVFEMADAIQILMPSYEKIVRKYISPQKIFCIPNVIPQYEECTCWDSNTIINVGRIDCNQKRQHLLIEAFAKLKDEFPNWKIEFWGEYDSEKKYYEELKKKVSFYNLDGQVKFCGTTKNIKEKLQKASIFAFPSAYEGFPNALGEAMAMGLPSIGYQNCPGVNELIKNGENGLLVNENIDCFANALKVLMENYSLRKTYGLRARNDMKKFSSNTIWNLWEKFFYDVING